MQKTILNNIFLYGAGGHGRVVCEILELSGVQVSCFFDDNSLINEINNVPVRSDFSQLSKVGIVTIGCNLVRRKIVKRLHDREFLTALHPHATLSQKATIEEGSVVMSGVSINPGVLIGKHTILNTNSSVDHDCIIGDYVHISPNVALAGGVNVGEGTHIGIGACVIPGIRIGKWATIGAGSVIIRDVPDYAVVIGNPGKILKYNNRDE
jgi:sugar O-acyltransferase (sialic acid O-acetyltransferase NeuD family)